MASVICGDTCIQAGKPHVCSARPGHKLNVHICCCGAKWMDPQQRNLSKTADSKKKPS